MQEFNSIEVYRSPSHNSADSIRIVSVRRAKCNLDLCSDRKLRCCKHVHAVFAQVNRYAIDPCAAAVYANRQRNPLTL